MSDVCGQKWLGTVFSLILVPILRDSEAFASLFNFKINIMDYQQKKPLKYYTQPSRD